MILPTLYEFTKGTIGPCLSLRALRLCESSRTSHPRKEILR